MCHIIYAAIPAKTVTTESVQSQYWTESVYYRNVATICQRLSNRGLSRSDLQLHTSQNGEWTRMEHDWTPSESQWTRMEHEWNMIYDHIHNIYLQDDVLD